ncbi:hypothetical protein DFH94DRAFT_717460 [Russula ochroleuca]|jgi:small subunit ribosomal protein S11|uniref:Ribosomal protein S11 n=1 Tax=Russula ochroleuca TaxID=152965 RepID=A0A9P5TCB7_9AGAM|nr:hypothetical protein DFH94DRAFT_717460 [Russula ochroleuca]
MASRLLRASSSNLARHSQRPLSTSSPRYLLFDNIPRPANTANTDTDGPPTTTNYSRTTNSYNYKNTTNPFRLNLSQYAIVKTYRIHVSCTPNNTHIVMSNPHGRPIKAGNWTGGSCGFKGVNRSGYEAGYQCAVRAFARVKELVEEGGPGGGVRFEVLFKGFGQGREAVVKALMTSEGDDVRPFVTRVTDNTPIKIGGTRARKMRRL